MITEQKSFFYNARDVVNQSAIQHVAFIMDGNRRWAKKQNLPSTVGHTAGRKTFKTIIQTSAELGLKYVTTYAFSTENWGRSSEEVTFLMGLLLESLKSEVKELSANNVKLTFIGRKDRFNSKIVNLMKESEALTKDCTGLNLQIALDYGSRNEIASAVKAIVKDVQAGLLDSEEIDETTINNYLYTKNVPDPDLIIRTGGENRLSNYLLWQAAYSELYITDTFWPEFTKDDFCNAIIEFAQRQRRWGKD